MDVLVEIDKFGRMVLPKKIRDKIREHKFAVEVEERRIVLTPVRSIDEMFGSMPKIDVKGFAKEHAKER